MLMSISATERYRSRINISGRCCIFYGCYNSAYNGADRSRHCVRRFDGGAGCSCSFDGRNDGGGRNSNGGYSRFICGI